MPKRNSTKRSKDSKQGGKEKLAEEHPLWQSYLDWATKNGRPTQYNDWESFKKGAEAGVRLGIAQVFQAVGEVVSPEEHSEIEARVGANSSRKSR